MTSHETPESGQRPASPAPSGQGWPVGPTFAPPLRADTTDASGTQEIPQPRQSGPAAAHPAAAPPVHAVPPGPAPHQAAPAPLPGAWQQPTQEQPAQPSGSAGSWPPGGAIRAGAGLGAPPAPAPFPNQPPFVPAPGAPARSRPLGWILLAATAALVVLIGGVGVVLFVRRGDTGRTPTAGRGSGVTSESSSPPAAATAGAATGQSPSGAPSANGEPGSLLIDEEFPGTALDTTHWSVYQSTAPNGSLWDPRMVAVADGELQVAGEGRNPTGAGNVSGGLCLCGGGDRLYGKWVVRARFDAGAGYGPAIGLWPRSNQGSDGGATVAGVPAADRKTVYAKLFGHGTSASKALHGDFTAWHTYTIEWRATFVKMYVDDQLLFDSTTTDAAVPQGQEHLYIQQIVGPDGDVPAPDPSTPDRVVMHIDWVKLYR